VARWGSWSGLHITVDIELTNRCNAACSFCPREKTPHQGLISDETFCRALERTVEHRDVVEHVFPDSWFSVVFCGMGEPLLHPRVVEYARRATAAGLEVHLSTNGSLLDDATGRALLDAGVRAVFLNIGDHGAVYEAVYRLPFERTRDRVVAFARMAGQRCRVVAVLVDHRNDPGHLDAMRSYWAGLGIERAHPHALNNRGGSLHVEHMQYDEHPYVVPAWEALDHEVGTPMCEVPFHRMFIGYDGRYYLCSSDWEKRAKVGSVFEGSLLDATQERTLRAADRSPVCRTCSLDPTNRLAEALAEAEDGGVDQASIDEARRAAVARVAVAHRAAARLGATVPAGTRPQRPPTRIPVIPA
jgi:sulfatase maturation enzyme AslB (radical SAM superfamily)